MYSGDSILQYVMPINSKHQRSLTVAVNSVRSQLSSGTVLGESSYPGLRDQTRPEEGLCGNQSPGIHMASARENVSGSDRYA